MFQFFKGLFSWETPVQSKGLLLGLDYAGKSTLLYKLKQGKVVTTIPTIGFAVETVETTAWKLDSWDLGGCDKIRPLWHHYVAEAEVVVWLHDCSDEDRHVESLEELREILSKMKEKRGRHVFVMLNKQDLISEDVRLEKVAALHRRFDRALTQWKSDLYIEVMDLPGLNCVTGHQLDKALARIKTVLLESKKEKKSGNLMSSQIEKSAQPPRLSESDLVDRIRKASDAAARPAVFWSDFITAELPVWDHFTHLRAGYFVLIDQMSTGSSLLDCADEFIKHLERLRKMNPDRFRNTTHRTMTVFWLAQIHVAALEYSANSDGLKTLPSRDKFSAVLYQKPVLMNSNLWREYYSNDLMFSSEARARWVRPNIRPLPTVHVADDKVYNEKV